MSEYFKYISPENAYKAYVAHGYNKKRASNSLGIPRTTFRRRVQQHLRDLYGTPEVEHRVLYLCDFHGPYFQDQRAIDVLLEYVAGQLIDTVVLGGDILELQSLSTFVGDIRKKVSFEQELRDSRKFVRKIRGWFPDPEMVYLKGNHEERFNIVCVDNPQRMLDYVDQALPHFLELDDLDIEFVDNREYIKQYGHYYHINNLYFLHGDEIESASASRFSFHKYNSIGVNLIHGHHHTPDKYITKTMNNLFTATSVGCLCNLYPPYKTANKHIHGFAIIDYFRDGAFNVKNHYIYNDRVFI